MNKAERDLHDRRMAVVRGYDSMRADKSDSATSEIEDALWALHSYESNRDDGVRAYSEADITRMVAALRSSSAQPVPTYSYVADRLRKMQKSAEAGELYGFADDCRRLLAEIESAPSARGWRSSQRAPS